MRATFQVQVPGGLIFRRGDLTEVFLRHRFGGLIFGGAYFRNFAVAILMYKVKNNMCPTYISTLFEEPAIKYKLRNHDFTIPRFNTVSFGKHSFRYRGPKVWSSVTSNVRKAPTLEKESGS